MDFKLDASQDHDGMALSCTGCLIVQYVAISLGYMINVQVQPVCETVES